jgi:hypothetical protein
LLISQCRLAAATRGSPEEKARGAAAGPFVGERVPREGERAAIEWFRDGALCPEPVHRPQLEVTFPRADGGDGAGFLAHDGSGDGGGETPGRLLVLAVLLLLYP